MKVYNLTAEAKTLRWNEWIKKKGCGLSQIAVYETIKQLGPMVFWNNKHITLGDIAGASKLAEREVARFAVEHLNKPEWSVIEYG